MKSGKYKYILLFITITILATIGLQIYWNLKNYKENKAQLIKEVQTAFDNSIEYYYVEDSKNDFLAFIDENDSVSNTNFFNKIKLDTVLKKFNSKNHKKTHLSKKNNFTGTKDTTLKYALSINYSEISDGINKTDIPQKIKDSVTARLSDSTNKYVKVRSKIEVHGKSSEISSIKVLKGRKATDSLLKLKDFANRIIISMVQDSIKFDKLSKAVNNELIRKNIAIDYSLQHFKEDTIFDQFQNNNKTELPLSTFSNSTYLPPNQKLQISFSDPTILILKRSFTEIILSLLLSLSIIFCLLYLLKTINRQKKIDEIKNDLISNITHEFKTPITTISSAIEGIRSFNEADDKEKTNRYLNISGQQLKKLEIMVEKLLETASLDTNQLVLNKENVNITELIRSNIEKHQMVSDKKITFNTHLENPDCKVDVFHFENAISNLIDNAIKYGGNNINVSLSKTGKQTIITIEDNGAGIDKTQREKIFDKFYRIPKGNVHDVKGFGIGLFYSKKIIEKHYGTLELVPNSKTTIFKISLPDVQ